MPHQCVKCKNIISDGSNEILKGCNNCGGRFFFFMNKHNIEKVKEITESLSEEEKDQMEKDALELINENTEEKPIILDMESIRILKPGKFEIDLVDLFKGNPLVYKLEDGKYIIDVATTFRNSRKK